MGNVLQRNLRANRARECIFRACGSTIFEKFFPCANHCDPFHGSMDVPVCPKILWIRHCRVLNMPLELRDSFAFVFAFYPSAKLQSERIFFGKIFVTDRDWNTPILKAIRGLSIAISIRSKNLNGNTSGMIIGYDLSLNKNRKPRNH